MGAPRRNRRLGKVSYAAVAGVVLALLATTGCQQLRGGSTLQGTPTEPLVPTGRFHDLPVPSTFSPVPDRTFIFENPSIKAGILVYKGGLSVTDTVNFFKNQMPANGWRLVSSFEVKDVIMKFEKVGWTCDITVRPGFQREIIIKIGPTANGPGPSIPPLPSN